MYSILYIPEGLFVENITIHINFFLVIFISINLVMKYKKKYLLVLLEYSHLIGFLK